MSEPSERSVQVNGAACRVWRKGVGPKLGVLAGLGGFPSWSPFLERLSGSRQVIVPSLPGFPGGDGHRELDDLPDWVSATLDLLEAAELDGADLIGLGVRGALAAEVAALSRASVGSLVLVAPFGLFDEADPVADVWARRVSEIPALHSARPEEFAGELRCPKGVEEIEWQVEQVRAAEAAARLLWPTGDLGLRKRLHRITADTLLVWGSDDRIVPASYAKRFADGISAETTIRSIEGAGHRVDFDAPEALAKTILDFTS